jgi:hypothetical protein
MRNWPECDVCGEKEDVEWVDDPFLREIHVAHEKRWLCSNCYTSRLDEI